MTTFRSYIINVLGTLTQGLNSLLGGNRDQSFSSRTYEAFVAGKRWGRIVLPLIDTLFYPFGGWGHCARAYTSDTERTYST